MFFDDALKTVNDRLNIRWPDKGAYGLPETYIQYSGAVNGKGKGWSSINEARVEDSRRKDIFILNNDWNCETVGQRGNSNTYIDQDQRICDVVQTVYNEDGTKIDFTAKKYQHTTKNKDETWFGAKASIKVGDDPLTMQVKAGKKSEGSAAETHHVRGDFGFKHDDLFVGYRHEVQTGGAGTTLSMGAATYKVDSNWFVFGRSDIHNKFLNAGFTYTGKDWAWTTESFVGLPLPEESDPAKQKKHPGLGSSDNVWFKSCFTSELSNATSLKWRWNMGKVWDSYCSLTHKVNDNVTVGTNHKYHSAKHGQSEDRPTEIGFTLKYQL